MKIASLMLACALLPACASQPRNADPFREILGEWTLRSILRTGTVQGPGDAQQRQLLGSTVAFAKDSLRACGAQVPIARHEAARISADAFRAQNRVPLEDLGIRSGSVVQITLNDRSAGTCFGDFPLPGQLLFVKNHDELVVAFEGVFYLARRK